MRPGIIVKQRFCTPGERAEGYSGYLGYINRKNAVQTHTGYLGYMDNPRKGAELFTAGSDGITAGEKEGLIRKFKEAEEHGGLMWDTIVSFDNEWLTKNGLYDPKTGECDDTALKDYIRQGVEKMLKSEGLDQTTVWTGAIHHNTDNIHAHIAITEPNPTRGMTEYRTVRIPKSWLARHGIMDEKRYEDVELGKFRTSGRDPVYRGILNDVKKEAAAEMGQPFFCRQGMRFDGRGNLEVSVGPSVKRMPEEFQVIRTWKAPEGKFKQASIKACKRSIANQVMRERETNLELNRIVRENFVHAMPEQTAQDREFQEKLNHLYRALEETGEPRGKWQYGNHKLDEVRDQIDEVSDYYLEHYGGEKKKTFDRLVKNLADNYERAYGPGEGGRKFIDGKNKDLHKRLGNAVLGSLRNRGVQRTRAGETKTGAGGNGTRKWRPPSRIRNGGYARPRSRPAFNPALYEADRAMRKLGRALDREMEEENYEAMKEHDRLEREIEQNQRSQ